MSKSVKWSKLVTLLVSGALALGAVGTVFAQNPGGGDLRRLLIENRLAQILHDLDLTEAQKADLKSIVEQLSAAGDERKEELIRLLTERRDALLAGDAGAVETVEERIAALGGDTAEELRSAVGEFLKGLTERQKELLARILPSMREERGRSRWEGGVRRIEPGGRAKVWFGPRTHPELPRIRHGFPVPGGRGRFMIIEPGGRTGRNWSEMRWGFGPMVGSEHLDVLLDMLD